MWGGVSGGRVSVWAERSGRYRLPGAEGRGRAGAGSSGRPRGRAATGPSRVSELGPDSGPPRGGLGRPATARSRCAGVADGSRASAEGDLSGSESPRAAVGLRVGRQPPAEGTSGSCSAAVSPFGPSANLCLCSFPFV